VVAVTTSGKRVQGPFTTQPYYSRIALHHYAVKSEEDFEERLQRGSVMSDGGADRAFWTQTERMCVPCPAAPACLLSVPAALPPPAVLRPLATHPCRAESLWLNACRAVETCYSGKKAWLRLYGEGEDSDNK
jgi:hypothetical protein